MSDIWLTGANNQFAAVYRRQAKGCAFTLEVIFTAT
jgi:hypothetical protein